MTTGATQKSSASWVEIPIDEDVVDLARFAVNENNKEQRVDFKLKGVWGARSQTEEGTTTWLFNLEAVDARKSNPYEARVTVGPTGHRNLKEFKLNKGPQKS